MRKALIPMMSCLLMIGLVPASVAQMYSWKDANGKIHYGDRPPAEKQVQARKVQGAPSATSDGDAARKSSAERQFEEREKQAKTEEGNRKTAAEDPNQARIREENCKKARSSLAGIESGQIRFSLNNKGERVALDGTAREAELARTRKSIDDWCKAPAAK